MESEQLYHRGYSRNSYNSIASASSDEELLDGAGVIMDFHTTEDDNLLDGDAASPGREHEKPKTSLAVLSFWALPPSWARPLMNHSLHCPIAFLEYSLGFLLRCILKKFKHLLGQRWSSSGCESPSCKCQGASCVSTCVLCFPLIQFLCHVPPFYLHPHPSASLCAVLPNPTHSSSHSDWSNLTNGYEMLTWFLMR